MAKSCSWIPARTFGGRLMVRRISNGIKVYWGRGFVETSYERQFTPVKCWAFFRRSAVIKWA